MVMLLALGRILARRRPSRGRVVLMFQPAEEDGSGARAVVADPAYAAIAPDWAFAIHNEPGRPFGHVATREGLINCASRGLSIRLSGRTAHAAEPEMGLSPAGAVARLVPALSALGPGGALDESFRLATVTHLRVGERSFGIAPGEAEVCVTLRSATDAAMEEMAQAARDLVLEVAGDLMVTFEDCDVFAASVNDAEAVAIARAAMDAVRVGHDDVGLPMRASEDFGMFGQGAKAAMLCLGPGVDYPALHTSDYDFPDDLIPVGARIFERIARDLLG
jgi:metal-dependent amidase/aminoacylase/carboxypeptidase family protein